MDAEAGIATQTSVQKCQHVTKFLCRRQHRVVYGMLGGLTVILGSLGLARRPSTVGAVRGGRRFGRLTLLCDTRHGAISHVRYVVHVQTLCVRPNTDSC